MKFSLTQRSGFTIIETLVAITVLMIAVTGPLSVAGKGLTSAIYARDQMIATFLAQETMESVKNIRDNNLTSTGHDWLDQIENCTEDDPCDVSASHGIIITTGCDPLSGGCILYLADQGSSIAGYQTAESGQPSIFARYFYIDDTPNPSSDEKVAHVIVNWYEGDIPNQVELTSQITNVLR